MRRVNGGRRVGVELCGLLASVAWCAGTVLLSAYSVPAAAQSVAPTESKMKFSIAAGPLAAALNQFAEVSGVQFLYGSELADKLGSAGVSGSFTVREGIAQILAGTGLTFRFIDAHTVAIEKAADGHTRVLGPVRVEGATGQGVAGINGSTDPTATEGTHSYTSSALSIASKAPQSIKDTPQSVSVITQQRMQDQNLTDFNTMMNQAAGITVVTGGAVCCNSSLEAAFYSRGFQITNIQIDGGAPLTTGYYYYPMIDMAQYDHVEILRGADGLFNGYGDPGGSVNLTRKRPLDHAQTIVETQAGSWHNDRVMLDATAPLGFDGKLRGRVVISYQDQDYFYDIAKNNHTLAYGILEADLTPTTVVSGGVSLTKQNAVPFEWGLPRYDNGDDLNLPRSTCLCFDWNRWSFDTKELFAQVEQQFGENWHAVVKLTHNDQTSSQKYGSVDGSVNPDTGSGPEFYGSMTDYASKQMLVDFTLNGSFELFGHRQQLIFGGNYQSADAGGLRAYDNLDTGYAPVDVLHFNPSAPEFVEPASSLPSVYYPAWGQTQWGAYTTLKLTLFTPLHFITGLRYSHYDYDQTRLAICTGVYHYSYASCDSIGEISSRTRDTYTGHDLSWPPTYSAVYDVTKSLSAYASYTDVYISNASELDESGHPLDPTTGSNIEVGLKFADPSGRLNASLAAYRIEQKDFPEFVDYGQYGGTYGELPDGVHSCCYITDKNRTNLSRGVDAEVTGELARGWQMSASYTYNLNEYEGSDNGTSRGKPLVTLSPKHLVKLWSSYQFPGGEWLHRLNIGGGVNAQSSSYSSGSVCSGPIDPNVGYCAPPLQNIDFAFTQGFYAVLAARLSYQIDPHWNAALNVNNLADRTYYQTVGTNSDSNWYGDPRNFMLTLRGTF